MRGGWLEHLVTTAEGNPKIGVVGAKLLYPDGRLQEAGNILWRDATGWNVGHAENPDDPRYNFLRDADYVSGSGAARPARTLRATRRLLGSLPARLLRGCRLVFRRAIVGLSRRLSAARGESCTTKALLRATSAPGVKRFQEINRPKFREKWATELGTRLDNNHANVMPAWRRGTPGKTILIVDSFVPMYDHEAGSQRMQHIVTMLREAGYRVIFLPDNYAPLQPYTNELQQMGVEVLHHVDGGRTQQEALDDVLPLIDLAWISRPDLYRKYAPLIRANGRVRVVYDTVDLSHVRMRRQAELLGEDANAWREALQVELECARSADVTVVVTGDERRVLEELGLRNVYVIPTIHPMAVGERRRFDETSGLLFIANYHHPPNVDAVVWLCEHVMPIVWQRLPDAMLTLVGSNPSQTVLALKSAKVRVTGYVRDVSPFFLRSRVFVAPLRFGAGMKGKIGQALSYALPVVTTPVGAEGLGLRDGENAIIAQADPHRFCRSDRRPVWRRRTLAAYLRCIRGDAAAVHARSRRRPTPRFAGADLRAADRLAFVPQGGDAHVEPSAGGVGSEARRNRTSRRRKPLPARAIVVDFDDALREAFRIVRRVVVLAGVKTSSAPTVVDTTGIPAASAYTVFPFVPAPKRSGTANTRARASNAAASATYPATSTCCCANARTARVGSAPATIKSTSGRRRRTIGMIASQSHFAASTFGACA